MYSIGVDLGGTKMAAGLVDDEGKILCKASVATGPTLSAEDILNNMVALCGEIVQKGNKTYGEIAYVGAGIPGTINPVKGIIEYANNLPFQNVNVTGFMAERLPVPIFIDNDANCAALGESVCGAAKDKKSAVTITLGTGVGGGIVLDGKILTGAFFGAGEVGHHVIVSGGRPCNCGRLGCWERYASATAIIDQAKAAMDRNNFSKIHELCGDDRDKIDAKMVFAAYDMKDTDAIGIIEDYYTYLSEGLTNIINILQPEAVVIGGGVSSRGESLLVPVRKKVGEMLYGLKGLQTEILLAALGNDGGIIGAAMLGKGI